jgi:hypothetical protein
MARKKVDAGTMKYGTTIVGKSAAHKYRVPGGAMEMERRQKHVLKITHIPTGYTVSMPAFLDSFSDAYSSQWSEQAAYGRMDSAATFGGTKRNISIAWNLPAESYEHAQRNLSQINALINFLYPLYDIASKDQDPVLNMDPILRLSFGNLVRDAETGRGLLGYVNGLTFDPGIEEGMFNAKPSLKGTPQGSSRNAVRVGQGAGTRRSNLMAGGNPQNNQYFPKTVRLNIEFRVLHEHSLGFAVSPDRRSGGNATFASYTFNESSLNFGNFPYLTNAQGDRATRGSWGGEPLQSQPRRSKLLVDPDSPEALTAGINHDLMNSKDSSMFTKKAEFDRGANAHFERIKQGQWTDLGSDKNTPAQMRAAKKTGGMK